MSEDNIVPRIRDESILPSLPRPEISLHRIKSIRTFEVIEADLVDLDDSMQAENQSLGFASMCLGALISAVFSWASASQLSAVAFSAFLSTTIILLLATGYFSLTWIRVKQRRVGLLARIRSQTVVTEETKWQRSDA